MVHNKQPFTTDSTMTKPKKSILVGIVFILNFFPVNRGFNDWIEGKNVIELCFIFTMKRNF